MIVVPVATALVSIAILALLWMGKPYRMIVERNLDESGKIVETRFRV